MALGTLTHTSQNARSGLDVVFHDEVTLVGDASYPTGGTAGFQAAMRALTKDQREILAVIPIGAQGAAGRMPVWDKANGKLMMFNGASEVANATDLSAITYRLLVISR